MLRYLPFLLMIGFGLLAWRLSAWHTAKELHRNSTPLADAILLAIAARMARAQGVAEIPVRIYDIAPVNGLAAPDGRIYLTRGFYDRYRAGDVTAEEMASVIAHELGHVALGHSRRRMIDFAGQNAVRMMLGLLLARLVPGLGPMLASLASQALAARLSRQDEYEADAYAAALLSKAGIGTAPQKSLLAKLGRIAGSGHPAPAWLLSHPATQDRIRAIETLEARWTQPS